MAIRFRYLTAAFAIALGFVLGPSPSYALFDWLCPLPGAYYGTATTCYTPPYRGQMVGFAPRYEALPWRVTTTPTVEVVPIVPNWSYVPISPYYVEYRSRPWTTFRPASYWSLGGRGTLAYRPIVTPVYSQGTWPASAYSAYFISPRGPSAVGVARPAWYGSMVAAPSAQGHATGTQGVVSTFVPSAPPPSSGTTVSPSLIGPSAPGSPPSASFPTPAIVPERSPLPSPAPGPSPPSSPSPPSTFAPSPASSSSSYLPVPANSYTPGQAAAAAPSLPQGVIPGATPNPTSGNNGTLSNGGSRPSTSGLPVAPLPLTSPLTVSPPEPAAAGTNPKAGTPTPINSFDTQGAPRTVPWPKTEQDSNTKVSPDTIPSPAAPLGRTAAAKIRQAVLIRPLDRPSEAGSAVRPQRDPNGWEAAGE